MFRQKKYEKKKKVNAVYQSGPEAERESWSDLRKAPPPLCWSVTDPDLNLSLDIPNMSLSILFCNIIRIFQLIHFLYFWATCLNLKSAQRNRSWKWNSANSTTCTKIGIEEGALDERAKLCEIFHLGWDKVEDSLALEHVEVCLHLLKVGEALVLEEGVDGGEHLLQDLPRLAQPTFSTLL